MSARFCYAGRCGLSQMHFRCCEGFRMPADDDGATHSEAGVRKPPKEEIAGRGTWEVRRALSRIERCT
jgi:hypothetical protein